MQTPPSVKSLAEAYSAIQTPEPVFEAMEDVLQNETAEVELALKEAAAPEKPQKPANPHFPGSANHYSHEANYATAAAKHYSSAAKTQKSKAGHNLAADAHLKAFTAHSDAAEAHRNVHGGGAKHRKMAAYHWKQVKDHEQRGSVL